MCQNHKMNLYILYKMALERIVYQKYYVSLKLCDISKNNLDVQIGTVSPEG